MSNVDERTAFRYSGKHGPAEIPNASAASSIRSLHSDTLTLNCPFTTTTTLKESSIVRRIRKFHGLMLLASASLLGAVALPLITLSVSAASTKTPEFLVPRAIAADGSHLWVTNEGSNTLTELNASNGSLVRVINAKVDQLEHPGAIVAYGPHVWVLSGISGAKRIMARAWITELNASNGSLVRVINARSYGFDENSNHSLALSAKDLWVANGNNSLTELNTTNGALVRIINAKADEFNAPTAIAVSGSKVWVVNSLGDSVTELNASNGSLVRVINAKADEIKGPSDIAVSGSKVWVTSSNNDAYSTFNAVTELNATNGALVRIISAKADGLDSPANIAFSGTHAWVVNFGNNSITEFSATNGSLIRTIK